MDPLHVIIALALALAVLLMVILAVSMFPQIAVLSGLFELIRALGIYNTPWALIFSYTIFTLPFTVWVLTTFKMKREFKDYYYGEPSPSPFHGALDRGLLTERGMAYTLDCVAAMKEVSSFHKHGAILLPQPPENIDMLALLLGACTAETDFDPGEIDFEPKVAQWVLDYAGIASE